VSGIWQSPTGVPIALHEGQLFPGDSGRACVWTYAGILEPNRN
jgi:hypothetical protein